jgi:hypothetical protein
MGAVPRFATSYYIVNTLLVGSYVLVRLWFAKSDPDTRRGQIKTDEQLLSWVSVMNPPWSHAWRGQSASDVGPIVQA